MIKINCNATLFDFKGKVIQDTEKKDVKIGTIVANTLAGHTSNPALAWQLGRKFASEDFVELKAEDVVFIKRCLSESQTLASVISGQLLEILEKPFNKD